MSFLKITDPKKRDLIVNDYLKTKEHIKKQQTEERTVNEIYKWTLENYSDPLQTYKKVRLKIFEQT